MDLHQLGVAFAAAHLAEFRRRADQRRLASRVPDPTAGQQHHEPGMFDAGLCRACARQAGLLDHHRRVQQEETTPGRPTGGRMRPAGAPAWRRGRPVPRSCWPPSAC